VPKEELVYVRSLLEASEGLGFFIAKSGGELLLVCPVSQSRQLDQFVSDLSQEVPLVHRTLDVDHGAYDVVG
jgi:hypothetical protein